MENDALQQPPHTTTMQDPNTGFAMFESAALVRYLYHQYGMETQQTSEVDQAVKNSQFGRDLSSWEFI